MIIVSMNVMRCSEPLSGLERMVRAFGEAPSCIRITRVSELEKLKARERGESETEGVR